MDTATDTVRMQNQEAGLKKTPFVTIIIPCRNEEKFIRKCLDSILQNDYPKTGIELFVIDGMSDDQTAAIVTEYAEKNNFIKIYENPNKIVPAAMNIGIKKSVGDIIIRMDAHSIYPKDYISKCVKYLIEYDADNIGGVWITLPGSDTFMAKAISSVLSHPFGVGNAYFRVGAAEPKVVDTVPFGCYKKTVFSKIGLFNEKLVRNQDIDFNLRLKRAGGKIILMPDIVSYYHARSTFGALAKNNFLNGYWVFNSLKFADLPFSVRHLVPFLFLLSILSSLISSFFIHSFIGVFLFIVFTYFILNMSISLKLSLGRKDLRYVPLLLLAFGTLHFSYGIGSVWGLLRLYTK